MFGYVRPLEGELRVHELQEYHAHYCGLCKAIGERYGLLSRLTLTYDCAFLSAFLSAYTGQSACRKRRCLCHLMRGRQPMQCMGEHLSYASDVNVLLAWHSVRDHWQDEHRFFALLYQLLLRSPYRRAVRNRPALAETVDACLTRLHALERAHVTCTDEPSDVFAVLMREIILHAPDISDTDLDACGWMFYNLGRWIYLADAWDDRKKDKKRGVYNPFLAAGTTREEAAFLLYKSLDEAENGYDLVRLSGEHGLVDNIIQLGCRERTRQLLFGNEEKLDESI